VPSSRRFFSVLALTSTDSNEAFAVDDGGSASKTKSPFDLARPSAIDLSFSGSAAPTRSKATRTRSRESRR